MGQCRRIFGSSRAAYQTFNFRKSILSIYGERCYLKKGQLANFIGSNGDYFLNVVTILVFQGTKFEVNLNAIQLKAFQKASVE